MKTLQEMSLPRLVAEYLDVGRSTDGRSLAAIDAELSRRQAMLDAADVLEYRASYAVEHYELGLYEKELREAIAAFAAAKGDR